MLPFAVKNLLIINGLFFLATIGFQSTFNIDLYRVLGLHFFGATDFKPYQLVTYMFMHGNFSHLFFNMFALWMFGNVLENVWGPKRFLIYYFVTGFGAAIIHYMVVYWQMWPTLQAIDLFLQNPSNDALQAFVNSEHLKVVSYDIQTNFELFRRDYNALVGSNPQEALVRAINFMNQYRVDFMNAPVVVGASGAVFGILLAFGMLFPNSLIYLFFAIPIKAKYFVMIYGAMELYFGISGRAGDNVAHFAHLGGMIFGYFLIRYWRKKMNRNFY
ncbi:MAG: rhomboid family intramembrane serine protease [Bacteroidales bacterium]|nr:rhomboid family intramembrane serine protease [Bacteroidales bacterium]